MACSYLPMSALQTTADSSRVNHNLMINRLARVWVTCHAGQLPGRLRLDRFRPIRKLPGRFPRRLRRLVALALVAVLIGYELRTSALQSLVLSYYARQLSFTVEKGASPRIVFPDSGPFDERRGYTKIPAI